jgi:2,3-dihydroxyphenylpropionate 1,2-dioxygenase
MDPSWHHNYVSLGWTEAQPADHAIHYPAVQPNLVALTSALHGLAHDADRRGKYLADPEAYARDFGLSPDHSKALVALDLEAIAAMGAHPLVPFLAKMQVERMRRG